MYFLDCISWRDSFSLTEQPLLTSDEAALMAKIFQLSGLEADKATAMTQGCIAIAGVLGHAVSAKALGGYALPERESAQKSLNERVLAALAKGMGVNSNDFVKRLKQIAEGAHSARSSANRR